MNQQPHIKLEMGIKGRIGLTVRHWKNLDTDNPTFEDEIYPEFDNLVTNQGLDLIGVTNNPLIGLQGGVAVGTGNTAPAATDTTLVAGIGFTTTQSNQTSSNTPTAPYASNNIITWTFAVGGVVGNIAEIGMLCQNSIGSYTAGSPVSTRALIQVGGSPGTITLLSTDQLIVTYTLSATLTSNVTGSFTITTDGVGTSFNYTIAPIALPSGPGNFYTGQAWNQLTYTLGNLAGVSSGPSNESALQSTTATCNPTHTFTSASASTYVTGSFNRQFTFVLGTNNAISGMQLFYFGMSYMGFQMLLNNPINFLSTQTLSITMQFTWANAS